MVKSDVNFEGTEPEAEPAATPDHIDVRERANTRRDDRLTLRLSPEARETLEWLARERGTNLGDVIRRALGTERFFLEAAKRNAAILIEEPGKRTKEIFMR